jgi:hypothetical protein
MKLKYIVWSSFIANGIIAGVVISAVFGDLNLTVGLGLAAVALATLIA